MSAKYVITEYSRVTGAEVRTREIHVTSDQLRPIFGRPAEDPMFDVYRITAKEKAALEKLTGQTIELEPHNIYIEAE